MRGINYECSSLLSPQRNTRTIAWRTVLLLLRPPVGRLSELCVLSMLSFLLSFPLSRSFSLGSLSRSAEKEVLLACRVRLTYSINPVLSSSSSSSSSHTEMSCCCSAKDASRTGVVGGVGSKN